MYDMCVYTAYINKNHCAGRTQATTTYLSVRFRVWDIWVKGFEYLRSQITGSKPEVSKAKAKWPLPSPSNQKGSTPLALRQYRSNNRKALNNKRGKATPTISDKGHNSKDNMT